MSNATRNACGLLLSWLLGVAAPYALALNPSLDLNQYAHTAWRVREGFTNGQILSLAQTSDGFLWLGTESGLLRFDGVRTSSRQPPPGASFSGTLALLAARDGGLWIGRLGGLARLTHGQFLTYPELDQTLVFGLAYDRQGTIWASASFYRAQPPTMALCAIRDRRTECFGRDGQLGGRISAPLEDRHGNLWVAAEKGIWRWEPGPPQLYTLPDAVAGDFIFYSLSETPTGVLVLTVKGLDELVDGKVKNRWVAPAPGTWHPQVALTDRDGAVWIGTPDRGLFHLHDGRMDQLAVSNGLSGDNIRSLFEDREGNIWVATDGGLDRFRAFAATTYSAAQGITGLSCSILADRDGSIWFSTSSGLYHRVAGRLIVYRAREEQQPQTASGNFAAPESVREIRISGFPKESGASLFQDHLGRLWLGTMSGLGYLEGNRFVTIEGVPRGHIDSITEDRDGNLWVAHRETGLYEFSSKRIAKQISWPPSGTGGGVGYRLAADPVHGGLWIGSPTADLTHLVDGHVQATYGAAHGLPKREIHEIRVRADGTVWVTTDGGLSRLTDRRFITFDRKFGLPCDEVDSTVPDDDGSLWLYMSCGLVRVSAADLRSWGGKGGDPARSRQLEITRLDSSDGIPGIGVQPTFSPHMARSADGTLWLLSLNGPVEIDSHHLAFNKVPPPVQVEGLIADRTPYDASGPLQLPPRLRDLEVNYTALSFVAPEKVLFRYKLEGHDRDWQEAGTRRQAFYTDLPPGNYRFRVIASNNSGVWNTQGASLDFSIAPAYWQTNWFRALCVAAVVAILALLYWLRMRQVAHRFDLLVDARVGERMRIARELHDTLLQSFNSALLRFGVVEKLLATRSDEAREMLHGAMNEARAAITEGRQSVQGLRSSVVETNDLSESIRNLAQTLASESTRGAATEVRLNVIGTPRALRPLVRDEVYRIAGEALRNAFRHAEANRIEVQFGYDARRFQLRVRDDGKGIDSRFLTDTGLPGHFGLPGMRERAQQLGGKLTVWSAEGAGTEVELTLPAARAYGRSRASPARDSEHRP